MRIHAHMHTHIYTDIRAYIRASTYKHHEDAFVFKQWPIGRSVRTGVSNKASERMRGGRRLSLSAHKRKVAGGGCQSAAATSQRLKTAK